MDLDDYMDLTLVLNTVEITIYRLKINNQFDDILAELNNLNDPLSSEILTNKPAVSQTYTKLQELVPLLKVDMTSALGVLITYQDNDGD